MSLPPPDPASTCVITGASSGIGADIARELAGRGLGVTLVARRAERLQELSDELSQRHGIRAEVLACDVTDETARNGLLERVADSGLRTEVLVNNAGFGTAGAFSGLDGDREVQMVRTNVEAVVALTHGVVGEMVEHGRGAILNVASSAAFQPIPRQATYAASKAFVLSFSEALSSELGASGVTVTTLCPGPVRTEFVEVAAMEDAADQAPDFLWISSAACARAGVEGLEQGRRVVVPHLPIRAGATLSRCTPHSILLPLMRRFYPA